MRVFKTHKELVKMVFYCKVCMRLLRKEMASKKKIKKSK